MNEAMRQQHTTWPGRASCISDLERSVRCALRSRSPFPAETCPNSRATSAETDAYRNRQTSIVRGWRRIRNASAGSVRTAAPRRVVAASARACGRERAPGTRCQAWYRATCAPDSPSLQTTSCDGGCDGVQQRQDGNGCERRHQQQHRQGRDQHQRQSRDGEIRGKEYEHSIPRDAAGLRELANADERNRRGDARGKRRRQHFPGFRQRCSAHDRAGPAASHAVQHAANAEIRVQQHDAAAFRGMREQRAELTLIERAKRRRVQDERIDARVGGRVTRQVVRERA